MERRNFLRGLLIGVPAAGHALVQLATPAEAKALVVGQPALIGQPPPQHFPRFGHDLEKIFMQGSDGSYLEVGFLTEVSVHHSVDEVSYWNGNVQFMPGIKKMTGRFEGR